MAELSLDLFNHIRKIEITTNRLADDLMIGAYHSAFKGRGMEFQEVREYFPGDDVRTIDWNVTARMNHPYIKSYREERELTVMIAVDVSGSTHFGTLNQTKKNLMVEIAALLAYTAIKNNDKVGLLLFSDQVEEYLPPKKGLKHILRIIRDLLAFKPRSIGSNLKPALDYLGSIQKKRCLCFLISDFVFPLCERELALTAKHHDLVSLCIYDKSEMSMPISALINARDLETGEVATINLSDRRIIVNIQDQLELRKKSVKTTMQKIGGSYLFMSSNHPYEIALKQFFRLRRIKH